MIKLKQLMLVASLLPAIVLRAETIKSPDGNLAADFKIDGGVPYYSLTYKGVKVVDYSRLGVRLKDGRGLDGGFVCTGVDTVTVDQTWRPVWG